MESRFAQATESTLPGEEWSTQRVREVSGQRGLTVVATQGFYLADQTAEIATITDLMFAAGFVFVALLWIGSEFYWSSYTLRGGGVRAGTGVKARVERLR